jgi:replicative DNA helicase
VITSRKELERSIVCAAFDGAQSLDQIAAQINDTWITSPDMRTIWMALKYLAETGQEFDPVIVLDMMQAKYGISEDIGLQALIDLRASRYESAHIDYHCDALRRHAVTDDARQIGNQLMAENAIDAGVIDSYIVRLDEIKQGRKDEIATASEAVDAFLERKASPLQVQKTGITGIDMKLRGGMRDGQLIVVGGRPGTGKSVLMTQIATGVMATGSAALIVSLEMTQEEIVERMSATVELEALRRSPLMFIDSTSEFGAISSLIRVACRRQKVGVVVLDYIQLCEIKLSRDGNREREIATMSRRLKQLAKICKVPIVIGSQLNRESAKRGKPTLADLRESGAIEQDADIVLLLHRDDESDDTTIGIAKHRGGATGEVVMRLNGPQFRFEDAYERFYDGSFGAKGN